MMYLVHKQMHDCGSFAPYPVGGSIPTGRSSVELIFYL